MVGPHESSGSHDSSLLKFRVGSWNVHSLATRRGGECGRMEMVANALQSSRCQAVCLQETRLDGVGERIVDVGNGERWCLVFSGASDSQGMCGQHGVGILLNEGVSQAWRDGGSECWRISARVMALRFPLRSSASVFLVCVYAPTTQYKVSSREFFYHEVGRVLEHCREDDFLLIGGDFNARVGAVRRDGEWGVERGRFGVGVANAAGRRLVEFCAGHGLTVANTWFKKRSGRSHYTWTNRGRASRSCIDFFLVRQQQRREVSNCWVRAAARRALPFFTDHELVCLQIPEPPPPRQTKRLKRRPRQFNRGLLRVPEVRARYQCETTQALLELSNKEEDGRRKTVEKRVEELSSTLLEIGRRLPRPPRIPAPWFAAAHDSLRPVLDHKAGALHRTKANPGNRAAKQRYRIARRDAKREVRRARNKYVLALAKQAKSRGDRTCWTEVKTLLNTITPKNPPPVTRVNNEEGAQCKSEEECRQRWGRHFQGVLNVESKTKEDVDAEVVPEIKPSTFEHLGDPPSIEEVRSAFANTRGGTTAGLDGLPPEAFKDGGEDLLTHIHTLFMDVWEEGTVPSSWRDAELVPLPKKGNLRDCDNWRGICLLSVLGKIFARVLQGRLQELAEAVLPESQCGFRPGRSTTDMVYALAQLIELAEEAGVSLFLVFVDLAKAYDSVPREALWKALRTLGAPEPLVRLVESFHEGTGVRVRVGDGHSDLVQVRNGLRQGCVMAPVLFTLYAFVVVLDWSDRVSSEPDVGFAFSFKHGGRIPSSLLPHGCKIAGILTKIRELQFADDLCLVAISQHGAEVSLRTYDVTARDWGLTLSWNKTKLMAIGARVRAKEILSEDGSQKAEVVSEFRYLGVVFSVSRGAEQAVQDRVCKAQRQFFSLMTPVFRNGLLSLATKRTVYEATVLGCLLYCLHVLPLTTAHHQRIDVFHNACVRRILGVSRLVQWEQRISTADLLQRFGSTVLPSDLLRHRRCQWLGHVARMSPWCFPHRLLFGWVDESMRKIRAAHHHRWRRLINRDLLPLGFDVHKSARWFWVAMDRDDWKCVCRTINATPTEKRRCGDDLHPLPTPPALPEATIVCTFDRDQRRFEIGRVLYHHRVVWEEDGKQRAGFSPCVEYLDGRREDEWDWFPSIWGVQGGNAVWMGRLHLLTHDERYKALDCFDGHYSAWESDRVLKELGDKLRLHFDPPLLFGGCRTDVLPVMKMCDT